MQQEIDRLREENHRFREALEEIRLDPNAGTWELIHIADMALKNGSKSNAATGSQYQEATHGEGN